METLHSAENDMIEKLVPQRERLYKKTLEAEQKQNAHTVVKYFHGKSIVLTYFDSY